MEPTKRVRRLVVGVTGLAAVGCGGGAFGGGSPAHQLAAGMAAGELRAERVACVIDGVPGALFVLVPQLPELRKERAAVISASLRAQARSVQESMADADAATAAGTQIMQLSDAAVWAHERGDDALATRYSAQASHASQESTTLGASPLLLRAGPSTDRIAALSDEDVAFLVRYATLRADLMAGRVEGTAALLEQLDQWDLDRPHIMAAYAATVLRLYHDPNVVCR